MVRDIRTLQLVALPQSDIMRSSLRGLQLADGVQYFRVLWKPAGFLLAVDQLAVDLDIEDAPGALDQLAGDAELALDRIRQTGGLGLVISLHAVFNRNVHLDLPRFVVRWCGRFRVQPPNLSSRLIYREEPVM